jgi:hypothetical protein
MYGSSVSSVPADNPSSEPHASKATPHCRWRKCMTWASLHDVSSDMNTVLYKNILQNFSPLFPWPKQGLQFRLAIVVVTGVVCLPITVHSSALTHQMQIWQIRAGLLFHFLHFSSAAPEYYVSEINIREYNTNSIHYNAIKISPVTGLEWPRGVQ